MKKFTVALSFIFTFILCIPSISVLADDDIKIYSYDLVSSALGEHDNGEYIYGWDYTNENRDLAVAAVEKFKEDYPSATNFIGMFSTGGEIQFYTSVAPINILFGGDIHYTGYSGEACGFYTSFSNIDVYRYTYDSNNDSLSASFLYTFLTITQNGTSTRWQFSERQRNVFAFEGDIHFYSLDELNEGGILNSYLSNNTIPNSATPENMMRNVLIDYDYTQLFDYADTSLPYYNGTSVIDPNAPVGETNLNHMYFQSCEIGFCEPYGVNNFATFGGSYFYVKYKVDDWILDHINDYDLYFSSTAYVGSRQYNGSKQISLDSDGCITIPFSDIFTTDGGVVTNGFVSAVSSKVVDQRFYKTYLYSIAGEKLQNFIDQQNNVSGSFSSAWDELVHTVKETYFFVYNGPNDFSEVIQDVVQSQIVSMSNVYKNYKINVNLYLIDNGGNRSGSVARLFDLYTGSDTSTDNQGLENENPYIDDSDNYLPDLPDDTQQVIQTSGSGSGVNVYNMTPSQIKLVIDNGFEKFVAWYNSDPSTAEVSTGFWNSFGIFRNNPAIDLYEEYFGFLPTGFKDIILGCATIGIVGGVFCAIRRKLT